MSIFKISINFVIPIIVRPSIDNSFFNSRIPTKKNHRIIANSDGTRLELLLTKCTQIGCVNVDGERIVRAFQFVAIIANVVLSVAKKLNPTVVGNAHREAQIIETLLGFQSRIFRLKIS